MTSTSTFQGMDTDSKPSSRVLAPPGGGSSNIFGTPDVQQAPRKKETPPNPEPVSQPDAKDVQQPERSIKAAPKQAYNPITGEPYPVADSSKEEDKDAKSDTTDANEKENKIQSGAKPQISPAAEPVKEKTSTRIAQPPGGKSTPLW